MNISPQMVIFIANREGEGDGDKKTPGLQPYMDIAGYWTWGFGHLIVHEGRRLKGEADRELAYRLFPGGTRTDAVELMKQDLVKVVAAVNSGLNGSPATQPQFDSMCSLCFNVGGTNFKGSSLLRYHRKGFIKPSNLDRPALTRASRNKSPPSNAPDQFVAWSFVKGGTEWSQALFNRRMEERQWYLTAGSTAGAW